MFFLLGIILFIIVLSSWLVAAKITREQQKQIATLKAFGWKTSAIVWRYTS